MRDALGMFGLVLHPQLLTRFNTPAFQGLLNGAGPAIRRTVGLKVEEVALPRLLGLQELAEEEHYPLHASPDMRPGGEHSEDMQANNDAPGMPVPAVYTSSSETSWSSTIDSLPESPKEGDEHHGLGLQRWQSPVPHKKRMAMQRNERRCRLLLDHHFSPSLFEYPTKPKGSFVTLFNASSPGVRTLPLVYDGYGPVKKVDLRTLAQRGDVTSQNVTRGMSFPLRVGHRVADMYTELTDYRCVESLDAPKW
ncbi:hypothetical protein BDQ17DRAFT_1436521 [Cyathus striatus]|nr:hypothetical protein BDQ17DRAFT_1436521 [Cyathus striatus]